MLLHKQQQKLDMQPDVKNSEVPICSYQEAAAIELNINLKEKQRLTDIIRGLEQKNSDQAKIIRESEKADELRKHQQEKNKAAGIRKQQEAAAGVIKKRKRKSSSKTKPSSMESK